MTSPATSMNALQLALATPGKFALLHHDPVVPGKPFTLNGYRARCAADKPPVVFVQHGVMRNGDEYRDYWVDAAEKYGLVIVACTFAEEQWPDIQSYNNGNIRSGEHPSGITDLAATSYACVQRVIQRVSATGCVDPARMYLFGHSAGSQFVHRYMGVCGPVGLAGAIAANAGWYTLPDAAQPFPAGWLDTGVSDHDISRMLSYPLQIFAGCRDNDPNAPHLPNEPAAKVQGPTRFDRAHYFYDYARGQAQQRGVPYAWALHTIPEVAHDGCLMSHVAAEFWFGPGIPDATVLARRAAAAASFTA